MTSDLTIPSNINWESQKGHSLEECTYWILEAIGAKEIDWRRGGIGGGAADGGRDLECTFHIPHPSGEIRRERWWVEVKGRSTTIAPSVIKESIHTIAGKSNVDVHLIVTNQQLSNPTKDWISEWREKHPRPDIRIWERQDLERLVSQNPVVAIRLFPTSLSSQGMCDGLSARFWEYMMFSDIPTLEKLWLNREDIEWDDNSLFAALTSECANGNLSNRPWGAAIPNNRLTDVYINALVNSFYLMLRADSAGVRSEPIRDALSHMLIILTAKFDAESVASITENFTDFSEKLSGITPAARKLIIDPVINNAYEELANACLADCDRVSASNQGPQENPEAEYWKRFRYTPGADVNVDDGDERIFYLESLEASCNAGLNLSKDNSCPMTNINELGETLTDKLKALRPVIKARTKLNQ